MLFIGDVHGKIDQYLRLIKGHKTSIQVGDMGFSYAQLVPEHKFIGGNHDNWDQIDDCESYLGRYGYLLEDTGAATREIFFVSGAYSIDKAQRTIGINWWKREELSNQEMFSCWDLYKGADILVSHDCPLSVATCFGIHERDKTRQFLQSLLDKHKPNIWIFGHWHRHFDEIINGCRFICLNELETIEI